MKKVIAIFFLLFITESTFCQVLKDDSCTTKVVIIVVVHTENKNRNADSLLEILKN